MLCSHDLLWVWIILVVRVLITQQWYQSSGWEHTKVQDGGEDITKVQICWFKEGMQGVQRETLMLREQKNKGNLFYLNEKALKRNYDRKVKKKMKFSNVVEVLGVTSVGGEVSSLSIWSKYISLLTWRGEL